MTRKLAPIGKIGSEKHPSAANIQGISKESEET